jgi:hypothetical protein
MSGPLEGWYFDDRSRCWRRAGDVLTDEQGPQWPDPNTDNIPVEVIEEGKKR